MILNLPCFLTSQNLNNQLLADLPLKEGQHIHIQLNQEKQIYAQILNSDLQVIQEIAENHIYFGLHHQQGEHVIKALREVPHKELHPVLQDGQLTLLLTLEGEIGEEDREKDRDCGRKKISKKEECIHIGRGGEISGVKTERRILDDDLTKFTSIEERRPVAVSSSLCAIVDYDHWVGARIDAEGVQTSRAFIKSQDDDRKESARINLGGVQTSRVFIKSQQPTIRKQENYLKQLVNKALQCLKEQTENLTQEVKMSVLLNIIIQIESLCSLTKKHNLKIQRKSLESILKNKEDIQKLIELLKNIE